MDNLKDNPHFKRLQQRESELKDILESLKESAKPVDLNNPIGRLSRMDALQHQQMSLHSKKQTDLALEQVKQAYERLKEETYGYCVLCEEEIGKKRLQAKPETPLCIECQEDKY